MNWDTVLPAFVDASVVVAVITAAINIIMTVMNAKSLKKIEKYKIISNLNQYRYVKIYEILHDWIELSLNIENAQNGDIPLSQQQKMDYLNEMYQLLMQKYDLVYSLIEADFWGDMDRLIADVRQCQSDCYTWLVDSSYESFGGRMLDPGPNVIEYEKSLQIAADCFKRVLSKKLQSMTVDDA